MSKPERNSDGTFQKGVSGNPNGRPKKVPARHRMPAHNRRVVFEVAETPVQLKLGEETVDSTAYRGVMMALAKKAMSGHTPSARLFIEELRNASSVNAAQSEFTLWLIEEQKKLEGEVDRLRSYLPKRSGNVMYMTPDGGVSPYSAHELAALPRPDPADEPDL